MYMLLQGKMNASKLFTDLVERLPLNDTKTLLKGVCEGSLKERNRAITIAVHVKGIDDSAIAKFLMLDTRTVNNIISYFQKNGIHGPFTLRKGLPRKCELIEYKKSSLCYSPFTA